MPRRLNNKDKDALRNKIKVSQLIHVLQCHFFGIPNGSKGVPKMTPTKVRIALALINKVLADQKQEELKIEDITGPRVISSKPLTEEEWQKEYGEEPEGAEVVKMDDK